jgi:hypothetical protein
MRRAKEESPAEAGTPFAFRRTHKTSPLTRSGRIVHDGNPVLAWMIGNVVGHYDAKPAEQARIVQLLVERVDVSSDGVDIRLRTEGLANLATDLRPSVIAGIDLLLVLKQGRPQAFGPKDEILSKVLQRDAPAPRPLKVVSDMGSASS